MKVIVLHLERSLKRREHIKNEFNKHNVYYEIFKAFDCINLTYKDFEKFCDLEEMEKHPNYLTPGMVCACYSHYLIYKKIIEENIPFALITEDDMNFSDEILKILDSTEKNLKENEVILLHYMSFSELKLLKSSAVNLSDNYQIMCAKNIRGVNSAAGYIITNAAAKTLSEIILPVRYGTDAWERFLNDKGIENIRFIHPMPIKSAGFKSTVAVDTQSKLRAKVTAFVDNYKVFPFHQILRTMRLKSIASRSKISIE